MNYIWADELLTHPIILMFYKYDLNDKIMKSKDRIDEIFLKKMYIYVTGRNFLQ